MPGYRGTTGGGITSFTDSLHGPAGSLDPTKWAVGVIPVTPLVSPVGYSSFFQTGALGTLSYQGAAGPGSQNPNYATPLAAFGMYGKTQFAQIQFRGATGTANNHWGPMVCFRPAACLVGYVFRFINAAPLQLDLLKNSPNASTAPGTSLVQSSLVNPINANVLNANDIMRISVDLSNPAQAIITCSINGVVKAQFVDNTPLTGGQPGLFGFGHDGNYTFDNFSCGLGT